VVNAPVVPDAVYIGRGGATPGISVIDMYGFGGGTGNPTYDQQHPIKEGNSNFPNSPDVAVLGNSLVPPLTPGTCTIDGGSEGVFTLTKDSSLNDLLARSPLLTSVTDMAIGHALDNTFNNGAPFGCQAGGGNICAITGLKFAQLAAGGSNSLAPSTTSTLPTKIVQGGENLVGICPVPNPPPMIFPPLCLSPLINSQEPTSAFSGVTLLVPGANNRGNPSQNRPPTNLIADAQNSFAVGPSTPQPLPSSCLPYIMRQQIGHFMYVCDRVASQVVVMNSNTFTVIDRISTPDPTSFAMSPNIDLLAVTNENADQVTFIDTDPSSVTFHKVVRTVPVGTGPTGIAWEPGNEDILVCNTGDGSVTVLSAFSLRARKTVRSQLTRPIDVAITPRQLGFGFFRGVYFAYILNQNGVLAVFESGPDGSRTAGASTTPSGACRSRSSSPRRSSPTSSASTPRCGSRTRIRSTSTATRPAIRAARSRTWASPRASAGSSRSYNGPIVNPQVRNLEWGVFTSVGEGPNGLSGIPTDIAIDDMVNLSGAEQLRDAVLRRSGPALQRQVHRAPEQRQHHGGVLAAVPLPGRAQPRSGRRDRPLHRHAEAHRRQRLPRRRPVDPRPERFRPRRLLPPIGSPCARQRTSFHGSRSVQVWCCSSCPAAAGAAAPGARAAAPPRSS
jgi:hypothetical protein